MDKMKGSKNNKFMKIIKINLKMHQNLAKQSQTPITNLTQSSTPNNTQKKKLQIINVQWQLHPIENRTIKYE